MTTFFKRLQQSQRDRKIALMKKTKTYTIKGVTYEWDPQISCVFESRKPLGSALEFDLCFRSSRKIEGSTHVVVLADHSLRIGSKIHEHIFCSETSPGVSRVLSKSNKSVQDALKVITNFYFKEQTDAF